MNIYLVGEPEKMTGKNIVLPVWFQDVTEARAYLMGKYSHGNWIILRCRGLGAAVFAKVQ